MSLSTSRVRLFPDQLNWSHHLAMHNHATCWLWNSLPNSWTSEHSKRLVFIKFSDAGMSYPADVQQEFPIHLFICLSIYLQHLSTVFSIYRPIYSIIYQCIHLSIYASLTPSMHEFKYTNTINKHVRSTTITYWGLLIWISQFT